MDSFDAAPPAATTYLLRRRPARGLGPAGAVVFTLEDVGTPPGDDPRATVVVCVEGAGAEIVSIEARPAPGESDNCARLVREALDALRGDGCATAAVSQPEARWLPLLHDLGFSSAGPGGDNGVAPSHRPLQIEL